MSYWILTPECRVLSRTTVQKVTNLELQTEENIARCKVYDERVQQIHSKEQMDHMDAGKINPSDWVGEFQYDPEFQEEFDRVRGQR